MKSFTDTLSYWVILGLRRLCLVLGLDRASALMGWIWQTTAPHTKRHSRADRQLATAMPHLASGERHRILRDMWENLGRTFAEGLIIDRLLAEPWRIRFSDEEMYRRIFARGDAPGQRHPGQLLISMHAGNWEAFGIPLVHHGRRVAALYQTVQNEHIDRMLRAQRETLFTAGVIAKGSGALKRVVGLLHAGDAVGILTDHRESGQPAVPFFGYMAPTTPLPARLALKTGAELYVARCRRDGGVRFVVDIELIDPEPSGDIDSDVIRVTGEIQARLERWIRERPHEWMWGHRRLSRGVLGDDPSIEPAPSNQSAMAAQ